MNKNTTAAARYLIIFHTIAKAKHFFINVLVRPYFESICKAHFATEWDVNYIFLLINS